MKKVIVASLFLVASLAYGQSTRLPDTTYADWFMSFSSNSPVTIKDTARIMGYTILDSTAVPSVPAYGRGHLVSRGVSGIYYQYPNGNLRNLDSTVGAFSWSVTGSAVKTDSLRLIQGSGVTLTQSNNTVTIAASGGSGDIEGVTVTAPISGGGTSGTVNITTSMATGKLIGRTTASTGVMEEITPNASNLTLSAGALNTIQDIGTGASPTFQDLTVSGVLYLSSLSVHATPVIGADGGVNSVDNSAADSVFMSNGATSDPSWKRIKKENIDPNARIDGTQLIDGTITNTELGYINTLSSNAQTQLGTKQQKLNVREVDASPEVNNPDTITFNQSNLVVTNPSGSKVAVNTIQDIGTGAVPTFDGLLLPGAAGATTQMMAIENDGTILTLAVPNSTIIHDVNGSPTGVSHSAADSVFMSNGIATPPSWKRIKKENLDANARIDATMLTDGTVSNTEFGYINTLSSNAQTQLNAKQATLVADDVTNALLANMAANTMKGNITGSTDNPTDNALAANQFHARSSSGNIAAKSITDFGLSLVDDAAASNARTTLGLGTAATTASGDYLSSVTSSTQAAGFGTITLNTNADGVYGSVTASETRNWYGWDDLVEDYTPVFTVTNAAAGLATTSITFPEIVKFTGDITVIDNTAAALGLKPVMSATELTLVKTDSITYLTGNATTTNTTATRISALTCYMPANTKWKFRAMLKVGSSSTTGCKYAFDIPTSATMYVRVKGTKAVAGTTFGDEWVTADATLSTTAYNTAGATTAAVGAFVEVDAMVVNGANAGNFEIMHAKVTSGTSTIYTGSNLQAWRQN